MEIFSSLWDVIQWTIMIGALLAPLLWVSSQSFRYYAKMTVYYTIVVLISSTLSIICLPWPYDVKNFRMCRWLMITGASIFGIKWELREEEKLKKIKEPCIFVCNHQSSLDMVGMMEMWPDRCVPMMKKELKYAGPFGIAGILTGSIFIDRFSKEKAIETCNKALEYMKENNVKMWVFPEGTRGREDTMLPFKKGAFHLAVQGQIPIVPVVFSKYSYFYNKHERKFRGGGYVIMEVLDPIPTKGLTGDNVNELVEKARTAMMKVYEKISVEAAEKFESEKLLVK